jgi:glucose dehydrogenase
MALCKAIGGACYFALLIGLAILKGDSFLFMVTIAGTAAFALAAIAAMIVYRIKKLDL